MTRVLFVNVDTQNDFMRQSYIVNGIEFKGKLAIPGAEAIEQKLYTVTGLAKRYGIKVINTADSHQHDSPEIDRKNPDYQQTFPEHCMIATPGAFFVPATDPTTEPEQLYVADWRHKTFDPAMVRERRNVIATKNAFNVWDSRNGSPHMQGHEQYIPDK